MFCTECGNKLADGIKFCAKCGTAVSAVSTSNQLNQQNTSIIPKPSIETLLEYLRDIIHCETSLIGFESTLQRNREIISQLCIPQRFAPPTMPNMPQEEKAKVAGRVGKTGIGVALSFTPAVVIAAPYAIYQATFGMKKDKKKVQESNELEMGIYNEKLFAYEDEMLRYNLRLQKEELRINDETIKKQLYEEQSSRISELITHTKETLVVLYGLNILHRNYQHFSAVSSIYDYLSTGRTNTLARLGNDPGAYNIYEEDVRIGKIINVVGMVGVQIVNVVNSMEQSMRIHNKAICNAIYQVGEMQNSASSQIVEGINNVNQSVEINNKNDEIRNAHLEKIAEFERIQAHALREWTPLGGRVVFDKSGMPVG